MDEYFGLYAVASDSLERVATLLAKALPLTFTAHDSAFWGAYLLHGDAAAHHVKVYFNRDPMWRPDDPAGERFFEPEYPNHGVLIEVTSSADMKAAVHSCLVRVFPGTADLTHEGSD